MKLRVTLLAAKAEPDQVERGAHTQKEATEGEPVVPFAYPMIKAKADATPDEEPRNEVTED